MYSIYLDHLEFYSGHGLYAEERAMGNRFEVSVQIDFSEERPVTQLKDTVDYVKAFEVIRSHMLNPVPLLETLAANIADHLLEADHRISRIYIRINKLAAPISGFSGKVGVSYVKESGT